MAKCSPKGTKMKPTGPTKGKLKVAKKSKSKVR